MSYGLDTSARLKELLTLALLSDLPSVLRRELETNNLQLTYGKLQGAWG